MTRACDVVTHPTVVVAGPTEVSKQRKPLVDQEAELACFSSQRLNLEIIS